MLQTGHARRAVTIVVAAALLVSACGREGRSAQALCDELDRWLVETRERSSAPEWMASADLAVLTGDSDGTLRLLERLVRGAPVDIHSTLVTVTQTWANMTTGSTAVAPTVSPAVVDAVAGHAPVDALDAWAMEHCGQPIVRGVDPG